jgi:hypothetical protein
MAAAHTSTVFVRNLAYGATDEEVRTFRGWPSSSGDYLAVVEPGLTHDRCHLYQLAEIFADVGPVRKSFIIKDKGEQTRSGPRACALRTGTTVQCMSDGCSLPSQAPRLVAGSALFNCTSSAIVWC